MISYGVDLRSLCRVRRHPYTCRVAERPSFFQAQEARPRSVTRFVPRVSFGRPAGLAPLMSWLAAVFAFDRWLLAIVIGVGLVAAGIVSTAFLAGGGRDPILIPALRAPNEIGASLPGPADGGAQASGVDDGAEADAGGGATPVATEPANREDCDSIRGSEYRSEAERLWYLQHCLTPPEEFAYTAGVGGAGAGVVVEPLGPDGDVLPTPTVAFGSSEASWAVADWLLAKGYAVVPGSCIASSDAGNQWYVTCLAEEVGCKAECTAVLSTCLIAEPRTIWTC